MIALADNEPKLIADTLKIDIEYGCARVGADDDAKVVTVERGRRERVADPFVRDRLHVELGAVRAAIHIVLRALVDDAALRARERLFVGIVFDEILTDLRPDEFENEAQVAPQRVVAQDRVALLGQVEHAERDERDRHEDPEPRQAMRRGQRGTYGGERDCAPHGQIASRKHGDSSAVKIIAAGSSARGARAVSVAKETGGCGSRRGVDGENPKMMPGNGSQASHAKVKRV